LTSATFHKEAEDIRYDSGFFPTAKFFLHSHEEAKRIDPGKRGAWIGVKEREKFWGKEQGIDVPCTTADALVSATITGRRP
jgi:hypothetical protein